MGDKKRKRQRDSEIERWRDRVTVKGRQGDRDTERDRHTYNHLSWHVGRVRDSPQ